MNSINMIDRLQINLKREYWEYRKLVWGIPIIMSILFILGAIMAIVFTRFADDHQATMDTSGAPTVSVTVEELIDAPEKLASVENDSLVPSIDKGDGDSEEGKDDAEFSFVGMYLFIAWLSGFYYLLSSLYTDRRDKSVLYWKSLPVSEAENVLSKLVFGSLGFCLAAIVVAWVTALVLLVVVHGMATPEELAKMNEDSKFAFNVTQLLVWPLLGLIFGLFWGAPTFAYILMVSAMSKRLPFMLLVIPVFILLILEGIFFRSSNLVGFLVDHTPGKALMMVANSTDVGAVFSTFFGDQGISLILGLLVAWAFLYTAVWYRNNRFEI